MKTIAVVIQTCDEYQKFWEGWYLAFTKWWDFYLPWDIYFCNEQKELGFIDTQIGEAKVSFNHPKIKQFKTPKSKDKFGFSTRLKYIFENLDYDYIFYMQEDMWLTHTISAKDLKDLFFLVQTFGINNLKIHQMVPYWEYEVYPSEYQKYPGQSKITKRNLLKLNQSSHWLMSHQASIWDRKFILPFISEGEDATTNELRTTDKLRAYKEDIKFYIYSHNWYLQPVGAVSEGKLTPMGEDYLQILQHEKYLEELISRKNANEPLRPLMKHDGTPY